MAAPGGGAGAVQRRGRGFEQREGARTGPAGGYDRLPERGGRKVSIAVACARAAGARTRVLLRARQRVTAKYGAWRTRVLATL